MSSSRDRRDRCYRRMWGSVATCLEHTCYLGRIPVVLSLVPLWVQEVSPGVAANVTWAVWGVVSMSFVDYWAYVVTGGEGDQEILDE